MLYLFAFILLLTPLVFVHELGHFLFAKIFGVRVDTFSIGFGPKVFSKRKGETEYCFSAIPLGGYVKLLGQDPTEKVEAKDLNRSFLKKEPWKRFLILIGGPLFNFLFAVFVFAMILLVGEPHLTPKVGRVIPGSFAERMGFKVGDVITAVDKKVVTKFEELEEIIEKSPGKKVTLRIKSREQNYHELEVTPESVPGYSIFGEATTVGEISGLEPVGRLALIAVPNVYSEAYQKGLRTGFVIRALNGNKVKSFEELEDMWMLFSSSAPAKKEVELEVIEKDLSFWNAQKGSMAKDLSGEPSKIYKIPSKNLKDLGIFSSEMVVLAVQPGSPAEKAGLTGGDFITSLNGKNLKSFSGLRENIQTAGAEHKPAVVDVIREGKKLKFTAVPQESETKDVAGKVIKSYAVGVFPMLVLGEADMVLERVFNPFSLVVGAWTRAIDLSVKTFISIKKLFTRQVSMGTLGGPLLIGKLAGDSLSHGFRSFLRVMALISVSLAVFNVLPVPVLDGGHIVLLGVEVIRGRPLGRKQTELVQSLGMSLIMFLLVVVLINDFSKVAVPALQNVFK